MGFDGIRDPTTSDRILWGPTGPDAIWWERGLRSTSSCAAFHSAEASSMLIRQGYKHHVIKSIQPRSAGTDQSNDAIGFQAPDAT